MEQVSRSSRTSGRRSVHVYPQAYPPPEANAMEKPEKPDKVAGASGTPCPSGSCDPAGRGARDVEWPGQAMRRLCSPGRARLAQREPWSGIAPSASRCNVNPPDEKL